MEVNGKFLRLYTTKHGKFIVSWDCFKETINACLYHGFDNWVFVSYFYERMLPQMKQLVETMSRGDFMSGSPEGVIQFLELPSVKLEDEGVRKQVLVRD